VVYRLWCDGAITKNPGGQASYGYVLKADSKQLDFGYGIIGSGANMNSLMAECFAISQGLSSFIRHWNQPQSSLYIYNDSKYVVSQLNKVLKDRPLKKEFLQKHDHLISLLKQTKIYIDVKIVWVPRSGNILADTFSKRLRDNFKLPKAYLK
jgi:ribonuclease HI